MGAATQLTVNWFPPRIPVMMLELWRCSCAQNWNQNGLDDQQCKAILLGCGQTRGSLLQLRLLILINYRFSTFQHDCFILFHYPRALLSGALLQDTLAPSWVRPFGDPSSYKSCQGVGECGSLTTWQKLVGKVWVKVKVNLLSWLIMGYHEIRKQVDAICQFWFWKRIFLQRKPYAKARACLYRAFQATHFAPAAALSRQDCRLECNFENEQSCTNSFQTMKSQEISILRRICPFQLCFLDGDSSDGVRKPGRCASKLPWDDKCWWKEDMESIKPYYPQ